MSIKITRVQLESVVVDPTWVRDHLVGRGFITLEDLAALHPPPETRVFFERHGMTDVVYGEPYRLILESVRVGPEENRQATLQSAYDEGWVIGKSEMAASYAKLKKRSQEARERASKFADKSLDPLLVAGLASAAAGLGLGQRALDSKIGDTLRSISVGALAAFAMGYAEKMNEMIDEKKEGTNE